MLIFYRFISEEVNLYVAIYGTSIEHGVQIEPKSYVSVHLGLVSNPIGKALTEHEFLPNTDAALECNLPCASSR